MNSDPNQVSDPTPESTSESPFALAPATNPTPDATTQSSQPVEPNTPKDKKKLIILISAIVGGLLLLGVIGAIVYSMFVVTKDDYKQAYDQLNAVQDKVAAASISASSESALAETKTSYEAFKTENAKLGDLKALRADSDLNSKYKAYDEKSTAYIAFMDNFLPSYEKFLVASKSISGSGSLLKSADLQAVITAIENAGEVSDPTVKAYFKTSLDTYNLMLPQVKAYEAATTSSEKSKALSGIVANTRTLSTASRTLSTDLKKRYDEVSPKDSFNELSKAVTEKYNN